MESQLTQSIAGVPHAALTRTALTLLFTVFLLPVQIGGIGYNYSFMLLPLAYVLCTGRIVKPPAPFPPMMALYVLIFFVAAAYQFQYLDQGLRRTVSFILFMGIFSYMFMKIGPQMIASFKASLVVISVLLSLYAMYVFFLSGGSSGLGFEAKDVVGSSRVGFIYLIAFWLMYLQRGSGLLFALFKYLILATLLSGLFLTFSRSSIIGLLVSFVLFGLANALSWCKRPSLKGLWKAIATVVVMGFMVALLYSLLPLAFDFFGTRLFFFLGDSAAVEEDLGNMYSTGGTRVFLLQEILKFALDNPVTGSGYLGVWILPGLGGDFVASAHNQYADVLFRTGFAGFLVYVYLLFLLLKYLYRNERALFWGFVAALSYGMSHETFKESQGGFVLAFLLGMLSQSLPRSKLALHQSA